MTDTTLRPPGLARITALHAKYSIIETIRIPIALIGSLVFPALALLFFVVPNRVVADDPVMATQAVISLSVFAVMTNGLFSFGLTIAENREKPWDPYLRTLPASGLARVLAQICSTGALGLVAILPVIVVGALATAATASPVRLLAGFAALTLTALPFMLLGTVIGYTMPMKAAIAVVQIAMFGFAFGGGLFLPPVLFADWLDSLSMWFPSRHAREVVIWAVQGGDLPWWAAVGAIAWTLVLLVLALVVFRRDEGRRFR
ncbi:ABC transporter permease [Microbacterium sp. zg-Y818]|uniref:ABC transporter permease n=1 Tax=unclassified Microbacterium TaxID=2609290 RepID=UPI00214AE306|nr:MULTISPECIES: ABC transporter permease [unclassified Microbacterium]MCR2802203.1 ABC transporter permease [Microbacterium sp. zg.Y818]WIM22748.1 ABC transporter permease [Microbacterium sp. zg-Y818]